MKTISYKLLIVTAFILTIATVAHAQVTKEEQSALTPDKVLTDLMAGNARFAAGNIGDLEIKKRIANTADGQYPKAVVLSCLDSRFRSSWYLINELEISLSVGWQGI